MEMTAKTVSHAGIELATEAAGSPEKGTILLAMGATASMVWWPDTMVQALAQGGYQVIRFDHRDTGQSTTNAPGDVQYEAQDLADDLLAILDAYDVQSAHFVGMSLGGYVSQIDAIEHPDRVLSLTLIASEPVGIEYQGEGITPEFMEHFSAMGTLDWSDDAEVADFMLGIARLSAGSGRPFDSKQAMARIERELARTDSIQSAFNHSMVGGELGADVTAAGITQPLLLIHGSDDPIISVAAARKSADVVSDATLLVLDGVGHELLAEDVPKIVEAILAHCAKVN
ncbi:Pimeloyl-ACP methyl ester carboxylesterase [Devosia sp. YR412]|nr:Pimeloyl-ACP methyl ester carboxylesterase [Devosia sp. YR412]